MEGTSQQELDLSRYDRVALVGAGKATAPMARAIEALLGKRLDRGIVVLKYGFTQELSITEMIEAGHPVPDQNGVDGTRRILEFLKTVFLEQVRKHEIDGKDAEEHGKKR